MSEYELEVQIMQYGLKLPIAQWRENSFISWVTIHLMEEILYCDVSLEKSQRLAPHRGINSRDHSVSVAGTELATSFRCRVLILLTAL
jgi:hypothetical protein